MKYFFAALCVLLMSSSAVAQQRPDRAMAIEYLKLSKVEDVTKETIKGFDEKMLKNLPPDDRNQMKDLLAQTMGWSVIKDDLVTLVMNVYTKDEINASIKFMKTPAGASAMAKSGEFSRQFSELLSGKMEAALKKCCDTQK